MNSTPAVTSTSSAWVAIVLAGLLECAWAIGMKKSEGFTRLGPSILTIATMIVSFGLLSWGLRTLPAGTGYAVWVGIGAVGTALLGMLFLGEPLTIARIACLALIIGGIVGLRLTA